VNLNEVVREVVDRTAAMWFSIFRLNPFDRRVYQRINVRTLQFWRFNGFQTVDDRRSSVAGDVSVAMQPVNTSRALQTSTSSRRSIGMIDTSPVFFSVTANVS
jgi:hypothetical protein